MSAFMANDDHLDLLASVVEWGREGIYVYFSDEMLPPRSDLEATRGEGNYYKTRTHASLIKEELRLENQASLWARYPKDANEMWHESKPNYRHILSDQATKAQVLGALACYEYQACESENWKHSYAHALIQAMRKSICRSISGDNWEYTRPATMSERVRII